MLEIFSFLIIIQYYSFDHSGVCKSQPSSRWSDDGHLRREISPVETEIRTFGSRLRYQCGLARKFYNPELSLAGTYDERMMQCNWNTSWTLEDSLDPCVWTQCLYPPPPPDNTLLLSTWRGDPVEFHDNVSYVCQEGLYFEQDREMAEYNLTCQTDGSWIEPPVWPICLPCKNHTT